MLKKFPEANGLPSLMTNLIVQTADLWARYPERPRPEPNVCERWDSLIAEWADDPSLPLYIRKAHNNRGSVVPHASGRSLVPTDNSPAQWAFALAVRGQTPSLQDIRGLIADDRVPVAMILKTAERRVATYKCTLRRVPNPHSAGWKTAHIVGVGLSDRTAAADISELTLREHFRKLMKPSNMFVIPLKYSGLAELPEFCRSLETVVRPA